MTNTEKVTVSIPRETLEVARTAARNDGRSLSNFTARALEAAGRRRLAELKQLAAQTIAASNAPPPASTAGEDHLREHRRLCGMQPEAANFKSGDR